MKVIKFIFMRFSAFIFDMMTLSLLVSIFINVVIIGLGINLKAVDILYQLSMTNSIFKTLFYLSVIGLYYGLHLFFRKSTFGLWLTHQDFGEKMPTIVKKESEDADMVAGMVGGNWKGIFKRIGNAFLYSTFQMINIAFFGFLTIYAAFSATHMLARLHVSLMGCMFAACFALLACACCLHGLHGFALFATHMFAFVHVFVMVCRLFACFTTLACACFFHDWHGFARLPGTWVRLCVFHSLFACLC